MVFDSESSYTAHRVGSLVGTIQILDAKRVKGLSTMGGKVSIKAKLTELGPGKNQMTLKIRFLDADGFELEHRQMLIDSDNLNKEYTKSINFPKGTKKITITT